MKKILILLSVFAAVISTSAYADDDLWITLGYGYYIPEDSGKSPMGPANLTIGGQVSDWVAIDFMIGYLWGMDKKATENSLATDIDSLPIRLHFLLQPKFDAGYFDVAPYIGIGPAIATNGLDFSNTNFSYGFSAKAGVRFIENGFLFGVGAEYLYNHFDVKYNDNTYKYNTSGVSVGAEIGLVF